MNYYCMPVHFLFRFYVSSDNTTCNSCSGLISNCAVATCSATDNAVCTECESGASGIRTTCSCIDGCDLCETNATACDRCSEGYLYEVDNGSPVCVPICSKYCEQGLGGCTLPKTCDTCVPGYTKIDGQCTRVVTTGSATSKAEVLSDVLVLVPTVVLGVLMAVLVIIIGVLALLYYRHLHKNNATNSDNNDAVSSDSNCTEVATASGNTTHYAVIDQEKNRESEASSEKQKLVYADLAISAGDDNVRHTENESFAPIQMTQMQGELERVDISPRPSADMTMTGYCTVDNF